VLDYFFERLEINMSEKQKLEKIEDDLFLRICGKKP